MHGSLEDVLNDARDMYIHEIILPLNHLWVKIEQFHLHVTLCRRHSQLFCVHIIKSA